MLPFAFGKAFNALGQALGIIKPNANAGKSSGSTKDDSENRLPNSPTSTEPLSGSPNHTHNERPSYRRARSPKKPRVLSETARIYSGSSPKSYFRSQRAYEISRPFRMNPPRKLTRQPSFIIPKAQKVRKARMSKKTKLIKHVEEADEDGHDVFGKLPESPTQNKGKKRARDDDMEDLVLDHSDGDFEDDGPSAPKRMRRDGRFSNQVAFTPASGSTSQIQHSSGRPARRSAHRQQTTPKSIRSSMKGRNGAAKKAKKVHFAESVVFYRKESTRKRGM